MEVAICDIRSGGDGLRTKPFAFTEHGALMLSSVLNSKTAIAVNIQIIRVFSRMGEITGVRGNRPNTGCDPSGVDRHGCLLFYKL